MSSLDSINSVNPVDSLADRMTRALAQRTSRRGVLERISTLLLGAAVFPLLPVARASAQIPSGEGVPPTTSTNPDEDPGNPRDCEYWRYCGIDGFLCSCCGGTTSACPPGTEMGPITWLGTCRNPADEKHYIIRYNDCCGKFACKRCLCNRNEREEPVYRPQKNNEIHWCLGTKSTAYTCSVAAIVGTAAVQDEVGGS